MHVDKRICYSCCRTCTLASYTLIADNHRSNYCAYADVAFQSVTIGDDQSTFFPCPGEMITHRICRFVSDRRLNHAILAKPASSSFNYMYHFPLFTKRLGLINHVIIEATQWLLLTLKG